jgi:hypothetical protein
MFRNFVNRSFFLPLKKINNGLPPVWFLYM